MKNIGKDVTRYLKYSSFLNIFIFISFIVLITFSKFLLKKIINKLLHNNNIIKKDYYYVSNLDRIW